MMEWITALLLAVGMMTGDGGVDCRVGDYVAPNGTRAQVVAHGERCIMIIATAGTTAKPPTITPTPTRTPLWALPTPTATLIPTPTHTGPASPSVKATTAAREAAIAECLEMDSFQTVWGATYTRADWEPGFWLHWCRDFYPPAQ